MSKFLMGMGCLLLFGSMASATLAMVTFTATANQLPPVVEYLGFICFWSGPVLALGGFAMIVVGALLGSESRNSERRKS